MQNTSPYTATLPVFLHFHSFFQLTGAKTDPKFSIRALRGLSQRATLSASLWRTSKAGNLFILLEKAPCERQTRQFGLCAALSLSVVKGGNSLKNGKEKQGAGVDAWVILVWNPSFLAKEKKQVGRLRAMSSSQLLNKPSDHSDKHLHESIKCSRETWHQPLWRTDTELPDSIILWDFI